MHRRRLVVWLATMAAIVLLAPPAFAQAQGKDQATTSKPAATGTPSAPKPQPETKATAPSTAAAKPKPATPPPPRHVDTPKKEADSLLGKEVYGVDGARMGLVTNVLVDRAGHPIALVIDFGGFLGVGSRKVAIDWKLMHFHPGDTKRPVTLSLSKEQLKSAPEYKPDKAAPVVQAPKPAKPVKAVTAKPASSQGTVAKPAPAKAPEQRGQPEAKPANPTTAPDRTAPK